MTRATHFAHPAWLGLAGIMLLSVLIAGCTRGAGEIPELSKRSSYAKIFRQIDQAEAKSDPVERCRSYAPPPHLPWPKSLTDALCADIHTPVQQAADIKPLIDRGDWKALHDRYAGYLERHYSGADPEKVLYRVFPANSWKNTKEADRYTRRWVAARPDDPYANTARGLVLMKSAWETRGNSYIKDVPEAAQRKMYRFAVEATVHLRKAIKAEPRLMPAYYHLIDAYTLGGKPGWVPNALRAAIRQSPDTYYVRSIAATYLQRRWGGSPQAMDALIDDAERRVSRNPRLAMVRMDRDRELADYATERKEYKSAMAQYRRALAYGPDDSALASAAFVAPKLGYHVERVVYLTHDIRFSKGPRDSLLKRGAMWESDGDFTRAMRDYLSAKKLYPEDAEIDKRIAKAKENEKLVRERRKAR